MTLGTAPLEMTKGRFRSGDNGSSARNGIAGCDIHEDATENPAIAPFMDIIEEGSRSPR